MLGIVPAGQPGGAIMALFGADDLASLFVFPCLKQLLIAVVGADHIEHVGEAVGVVARNIGAKQRLSHWPRGIGGMTNIDQSPQDRSREIGLRSIVDFVTDAVEDHAWMIAIAEDALAQVGVGPFLEKEMIVMFVFALGPAVEEFVHDQKAHAVTEIEKLRCGRIVGGADGIHAEVFQDGEAAFPDIQGNRGTDRAAVVMEADTFEFEILSIQPEAGFGTELRRADAEGRACLIDDFPVHDDRTREGVERGLLEAPELGSGNADFLIHRAPAIWC